MYWIGVDLDGTLAFEDQWRGIEHIGDPIPRMVERVKQLIADGEDVRIFTARASRLQSNEERAIAIRCVENWCETHLGRRLSVTNEKDRFLKYFWLYSGSGLTDDEQHERPIAYYLFYQKIACESPNLSIFLCDMAF